MGWLILMVGFTGFWLFETITIDDPEDKITSFVMFVFSLVTCMVLAYSLELI